MKRIPLLQSALVLTLALSQGFVVMTARARADSPAPASLGLQLPEGGSLIRYDSAPFDASASIEVAPPRFAYLLDFGFGILESAAESYQVWASSDPWGGGGSDYDNLPIANSIEQGHSGNHLSLQATQLSADGRQIVFAGELTSPGLQGNEMSGAGATAKFVISFEVQSCDGQKILAPPIDLTSAPLEQVVASLDQINPSAASYCDFKAGSLQFESLFKNGYAWYTSSVLHVDQDGTASLTSDNSNLKLPPSMPETSFLGSALMASGSDLQDISIQLKASGTSDPNARQSALAAAQSFSKLLKSYGELAAALNGRPEKSIRLQNFLDQNRTKITTLKGEIQSDIGKLGLTDLFAVLLPIDRAYEYVAAIDAQVNGDGSVSMGRTIDVQ